jgi:hypothetical protein
MEIERLFLFVDMQKRISIKETGGTQHDESQKVYKTVFYAAGNLYGLGEEGICRKSAQVVQRRLERR